MCGGGGGGGGSVSRVNNAPRIPTSTPISSDPSPRTEVKPTPIFDRDVIEGPKKAKEPPAAEKPKPKPSPLSTLVEKVTKPFRPALEGGVTTTPPATEQPKQEAKPEVTKPKPSVRPAPPLPVIPPAVEQPKEEPVAPPVVTRPRAVPV